MNRDELIRRLTATFLDELAEHVRVFNAELLSLEQQLPPAQREQAIHALFRAAHSLKGAARAVSATGIEAVAHQVEDLLAGIRDGRRELSGELFQVLFAAADGFQAAGLRFAEGSAGSAGLSALQQRLKDALRVPELLPARVSEAQAAKDESLTNDEVATTEGPAPGTPIATLQPAPASPPSPPAQNSVRIGHARLDMLLRGCSELSITRRRFVARRDELSETQEQLVRLRREWQEGLSVARYAGISVSRGDAASASVPKRLDRLCTQVDEELARIARDVERISTALREDTQALDRVAAPLEAQIHQLRLLPFSQACEGLTRVVRDLARSQAKHVDLSIAGGEIELDRHIVEGLREPLLHLVRNAIDHGIEAPEERQRAAKPQRASLRIVAHAVGDSIQVSVSDDGRGLDRSAIGSALRSRGYTEGELADGWERAIFLPGVSTAERVSAVSGRGVGLDIVRTAAERLNGNVSVLASAVGTRFVLALPFTLSTRRVLFVRVGKELFALPSAAVEVLLRVQPADVKPVGDKVVIIHAGGAIPSAELASILGARGADREPNAPLLAVVLRADGLRAALVVDEFLSEQEMILKPLGPRVQSLEHVSSGVLLASGEVALVLKPGALLASGLGRTSFTPSPPTVRQRRARQRLLLADDSLTTRALESSILEAAGYDVTVAMDGAQAWHLLQEHGADLLLSDVEMPNMDGLTLAETVRASARFRDLPIVLLTSRDSPDDRARGLRAGANAYLLKSAFDQTKLLRAIEQLL